jgi:nitrite reductase/ring-hydroxylating ferredoxin subunit
LAHRVRLVESDGTARVAQVTAEPSFYALALDLLGELDDRPTVTDALRNARAGSVQPARHGTSRVALVVLPSGAAYAVSDRCPHDGGLLSDGFVEGNRLVCARHGWEFDVCSGVCLSRPHRRIATRCLTDLIDPETPPNS